MTDRSGDIEVHRFDVANRLNGKAEHRAAVACRRGVTRFLDVKIATRQVRSANEPSLLQWVIVTTKTKNAVKDEAVRDNASLETLDHPAVDRILLAFTGNMILPERRITLKPE